MYSKMPTKPKICIFFRFGLPTKSHIPNCWKSHAPAQNFGNPQERPTLFVLLSLICKILVLRLLQQAISESVFYGDLVYPGSGAVLDRINF